MIELTDINQTLKLPEGFDLIKVSPEGAFIVLTYHKKETAEFVKIYVNDGGREVLRTEELSL